MSLLGSLRDRWRFQFFGQIKPLVTVDRTYLETVIFPWLAADPKRPNILFVGSQLYTALYHRQFPNHAFHTIDLLWKNRLYGSPGKHVTGNVMRLEKYYAPGFFDVVIFNGLIGWGLDEKHQVEKALDQARIVLKPGGVLIIGWNDVPERIRYPLPSLEALVHFRPLSPNFLEPGVSQHVTNTKLRHTFDFFERVE